MFGSIFEKKKFYENDKIVTCGYLTPYPLQGKKMNIFY